MNKLKLSDNTEIEVVSLNFGADILWFSIVGKELSEIISIFSDKEKISKIEYYENDKLAKLFLLFTKLTYVNVSYDIQETVSVQLKQENTEKETDVLRDELMLAKQEIENIKASLNIIQQENATVNSTDIEVEQITE